MESLCSMLLLLSEMVLLLAKFTITQDIIGFDGNSTRIERYSSFSRECVYRGEESQLMRLEWEFNGTVILYRTSETLLLLTIDEPSVSDAGEYFCIAVLSDGEHRRTSGGFLLIYSPELVVVPPVHEAVAGDNITLNCSSNIPGTRVRWRRGTSFLSQNVLVNVTPSQSGMSYECVVTEIAGGGLEIYTVTSQLHVIGVPLPPSNITLEPLSFGTVTVSWQTSPTDVISSFELIATISSISHVYGTKETFFTLPLNNSSICEKYELRVRARNDGGFGQMSEVVTAYLPLLPDVSVVESSLQHTVIKSESGVSVTITHQVANVCEDGDITHTIHISSGDIYPTSEINGMITYSLNSSHGLEDDARHEYNISVTNLYGKVYTHPRYLYTTDVQSVCGVIEGSEVTVLCTFAEGSLARGCKVTLISDQSNITSDIIRDSSPGLTTGKIVVNIPPTMINAQDLEENTSTSPLLPGKLSMEQAACRFSQQSSDKEDSILITAITASVFAVVCLLVVIGIVTAIFMCKQKGKSGSLSYAKSTKEQPETQENPAYGVSNPTQSQDFTEEQTDPEYAVIADL